MENLEEMKSLELDDIQKLLNERGISLDIKELVKEAKSLKEKQEEKKKVKKSPIGFSLSMANYPDFAISKVTARTTKILVFMVSCESFYIKTISSGVESIVPLSRDNYRAFTQGMESIKMPEDFYINYVCPGVSGYDTLFRFKNRKELLEMIRNHCYNSEDKDIESAIKLYSKYPSLYKAYYNENKNMFSFLCRNMIFIESLVENFGLENTKDYISSLNLSLIDYTHARLQRYKYSSRKIESIIPKYKMDYKSFKEYTLYYSVRIGFGKNIEGFYNAWNDTLSMQENLYGKIKEKYPKDLLTYHQQLSYKSILYKEVIDENKFNKAVENSAYLETVVEDYAFIIPKTREDFYDEATQQANCLASYINRFSDGECFIVFMRKKDTPEKSLVTIEVRGDEVVQKYQHNNIPCTQSQKEIINRWIEKVNNRKKKCA